MSFSQVQNKAFVQSTTTTLASSFTSNNTAGNMLVAIFVSLFNDQTVLSITDSAGNTWKTPGIDAHGLQILYVENCKAGANTVTLTLSSGNFAWLALAEYSGQNKSGVVLLDAGTRGLSAGGVSSITTNNNTQGGLRLGQAGELIIGIYYLSNNSITLTGYNNAGFVQQSTISAGAGAFHGYWAHNLSSTAGANEFGITASGNSNNIFINAYAFVPADQVPLTGLKYVRSVDGYQKQQSGLPTPTGTMSFLGGNDKGNTILVFANTYIQNSGNQVTGVSDTQGNTYNLIASADVSCGLSGWGAIYMATGVTGGTTKNTITVTSSGVNDALEVFAAEFAGGAILDTTSGVHGVSTGNTASWSITAAKAGELIASTLVCKSVVSPTFSDASPSTILNLYPEIGIAYFTPSTAGSNALTATVDNSGGYNFGVGTLSVALKSPSGSSDVRFGFNFRF